METIEFIVKNGKDAKRPNWVKCAGLCGEVFDALPGKSFCPDCEAEAARAYPEPEDIHPTDLG